LSLASLSCAEVDEVLFDDLIGADGSFLFGDDLPRGMGPDALCDRWEEEEEDEGDKEDYDDDNIGEKEDDDDSHENDGEDDDDGDDDDEDEEERAAAGEMAETFSQQGGYFDFDFGSTSGGMSGGMFQEEEHWDAVTDAGDDRAQPFASSPETAARGDSRRHRRSTPNDEGGYRVRRGEACRGDGDVGGGESDAESDAWCYEVMAAVHDLYPPVAPDDSTIGNTVGQPVGQPVGLSSGGGAGSNVKDFIAAPQSSGYRGLHSVVLLRADGPGTDDGPAVDGSPPPPSSPPNHGLPWPLLGSPPRSNGAYHPIEVQVRTSAMESAALFGMAAKWRRLVHATGRVQWGVWDRPT
jgi:hypothetical protein